MHVAPEWNLPHQQLCRALIFSDCGLQWEQASDCGLQWESNIAMGPGI